MTDTVTVVTNPVTNTVEIVSVGPQGPQGPQGVKGDVGDVNPQMITLRDAAAASATAAAGSASSASSSASTATTQASAASASASTATSQATTATNQAATATTKAGEASTSATNAATSASAAASSATTATTKASEASTSATNASGSASTAIAQATIATTKASQADASATAAAGSAANASTSASTASTQATNAANSASTATSAAATATTQATNASTSATTATTKANDAANSAASVGASAATASTQAGLAITAANAAAVSASSVSDAAATATAKASEAAGSAAAIAAVYGSAASIQTAVQTSQAQASLAQGFALSASSVVQQDLSAITAQALHRSPNAITAMAIYDTSKDSDGGAWTKKCQHTSWYNEQLYGKWLTVADPRGLQSEADARRVGATVGSELVTNGGFDSSTGWTVGSNWSISNGAAVAAAAVYNTNNLDQSVALVSGKTYRLTFNVSGYTSGSIRADIVGQLSAISSGVSSVGAYTAYFVATATASATLRITGSTGGGFTGSIDNVSVREVTTLNTASGDYYQLASDGKFYRLWKNLFTNSNTFTSYNYASPTSTVTANSPTVAAPDGTNTASEIAFTGTGNDYAYRMVTVPANTTYSVWLRTASGTKATALRCWNTGQYVTVTVTATWQRFSLPVTSAEAYIGFDNRSAYGGSATAGSIFAAQSQLEYGAVATAYEPKTAEGTTSEIFRGNKAEFPKLAGIVAESTSVNIYDLTEPGRPMWMRFVNTGSTSSTILNIVSSSQSLTTAAIVNSRMVVAGSQGGAVIDFTLDSMQALGNNTQSPRLSAITQRNAIGGNVPGGIPQAIPLASTTINAVAMTVLPDAPIDPATGLRVPTIAVATGGGVSVIKHNGTVVNSGSTSAHNNIFINSLILAASESAGVNFAFAQRPGSLAASFSMSGTYSMGFDQIGTNTTRMLGMGRAMFSRTRASARVALRRLNESATINSGISRGTIDAVIGDTFNTGWMTGDIRRAYLTDAAVGSLLGGTGLFSDLFSPDRTLDSNANWYPIIATASVTGGIVEIRHSHPSAASGRIVSTANPIEPGKTYRVRWTVTGFVGDATGSSVALGSDMNGNGGANTSLALGTGTFESVLQVPMTVTGRKITLYAQNGTPVGSVAGTRFSAFTVEEMVSDRSYKALFAPVSGTISRAQLATGTSLVGYSGFSASNYLREPYSADLDFGTGEWTASAWVNVAASPPRKNRFTYSEQFNQSSVWQPIATSVTSNAAVAPDGTTTADLLVPDTSSAGHFLFNNSLSQTGGTFSIYAKASGYSWLLLSFTGIGSVWFNVSSGAIGTTNAGLTASISSEANGYSRCVVSFTAAYTRVNIQVDSADGAGTAWAGNGTSGILLWGAQLELGSSVTSYQPVVTGSEILNYVFDRAFSSGPRFRVAMNGTGSLVAEAYDGTTTRTVTTTTAYNTATWLKARVRYTTDGTLAITVNGREVAATRGTPLLTLNNSSAVLTIGNSYALDAAFPGSIALLKLGATVPTDDQGLFMYEQEKQLFRAGAASVLPDSGAIVDMSYDDATDRWVAVSATNESYWTGLVRNSVTPVPAGSYTKIVAGSGVELAARSTTNPGVDISIPAYGLRSEMINKAEAAARLGKEQVALDYVGGFTATTTSGSTALTSVTGLSYPTSYIGARISGTGIPTNSTVVAVSGTTIYISAAATASASGVNITFLDFILPDGLESKEVATAGAIKQEGSTKDYTRLYDGFAETIRFGAAPGVTAWVQIKAQRITLQ